jgi:uncharacterized membrane protein HdeD (DUF308 family)
MSSAKDTTACRGAVMSAVESRVVHELQHLRLHWWWFMLLGVLLTVCGTLAIVFPNVTVLTSLTITTLLGVLLMVSGVAIIVGAFWAGKWSGLLLQLLVGILYLAAGFVMSENTVITALIITVFIAMSFIVMGAFRIVGALLIHFPQWGWALLNGVITMLAGIVIYRQLPQDSLWVIGLLVGLEMLFNGWTWIMLAIALSRLPKDAS